MTAEECEKDMHDKWDGHCTKPSEHHPFEALEWKNVCPCCKQEIKNG
jgi:hypothetical protein